MVAQRHRNKTQKAVYQGDRVVVVDCSKMKGIKGRTPRPGPEREMVRGFLRILPLKHKRNQNITIFEEPRLQSGFPDLIAVYWHEPTAMQWDSARAGISGKDFRLVHLLAKHGPQSEGRLDYLFQLKVREILEKLADVGLVSEQKGKWQASSLNKTFAVRRIVAFEAKMSDWRTAIEQAALNKWFASESYILLPRALKERTILDAARRVSVGIWVAGESHPMLECPPDNAQQPISYASWLFNEWAWRSATARRKSAKRSLE